MDVRARQRHILISETLTLVSDSSASAAKRRARKTNMTVGTREFCPSVMKTQCFQLLSIDHVYRDMTDQVSLCPYEHHILDSAVHVSAVIVCCQTGFREINPTVSLHPSGFFFPRATRLSVPWTRLSKVSLPPGFVPIYFLSPLLSLTKPQPLFLPSLSLQSER